MALFRELRRALRHDGVIFFNLGDSYAGSGRGNNPNGKQGTNKGTQFDPSNSGFVPDGLKPKDLIGIPWRVAFALQADGWWLRSAITWCKSNAMPESVTDRPTSATEQVFLLAKSQTYFYDADAIREPYSTNSLGRYKYEFGHGASAATVKSPAVGDGNGFSTDPNPRGRNRRNWWVVNSEPYPGSHFAVMPSKLVEPCILAGCPHKVCSVCGAPWVRQVEKSPGMPRDRSLSEGWHKSNGHGRNQLSGKTHAEWKMAHPDIVLGFAPTCACDGDTRPGVTLDPFMGSGTVGAVAKRLGRDWLGFELNADYITLSEQRIAAVQPPLPGLFL